MPRSKKDIMVKQRNRKKFLEQVNQEYAALRANTKSWEGYLEEIIEWENASEPLDSDPGSL